MHTPVIEFEVGGYFHSYYRSPPHQLISSTLIKDVDITCRKGFFELGVVLDQNLTHS